MLLSTLSSPTWSVYILNVSFCGVTSRDQSLPLYFCKAAPLRINITVVVSFRDICKHFLFSARVFMDVGICALPDQNFHVCVYSWNNHVFIPCVDLCALYIPYTCVAITWSAVQNLFQLSTWALSNNANCFRTKIIDDNSFRNCHVVYKYLATELCLPMYPWITDEKGASAEIKSGHIFACSLIKCQNLSTLTTKWWNLLINSHDISWQMARAISIIFYTC